MEAWEHAFREWRKKLRDEGVTCPDFKQAFMAGWTARGSADAMKSALRELATEVNRTLNMIVTAKSVDEIRWGATAAALTVAMSLLGE